MSRNSDRLGAVEQADAPEPVKQESKKSLFSFPSPTEVVELPSKGQFYPENHPLRDRETLEIRYMTTKHEEILINKSYIQEGTAIDRLLEELIVDANVKVDDLFACDKNALLIAARIAGYGADYEVNVRCPDCGHTAPKKFNLRELKPKENEEKVEFSQNGTFEIPVHLNPAMPESTPLIFVVEVRLLKGGDQKRIEQTARRREQRKLPQESIADLLREIVVSIRGPNGEEASVEQMIEEAATIYVSYIREEYARLAPNMDMEFLHKCPKCSAENLIDLPLGANFFRFNK